VSPEEQAAYEAAQASPDQPSAKKTRIGSPPPSERPRREIKTPKQVAEEARAAAAKRYAMSPDGIKAVQRPAAEALMKMGVPPPPGESLLESFMKYTPTTLVERVWGEEALRTWQQANRDLPARKILEIPGAQAQCQAIIEGMGEKPCYICGFAMGAIEVKNGLSPECEHILSVAQAILLYKLFQPGDLDKKPDEEKAFFSREYKWAHEICNQVKSDNNIISYTEDPPRGFSLDNNKLRALLENIYAEQRRGSDKIKELVKDAGGVETWIRSRLAPDGVLVEVKPLVDYLNKQLLEGGDRMIALVAATLIERVKADFRKFNPHYIPGQALKFIPHAALAGPEMIEAYAEAEAADKAALAGKKRGRAGGGKRHKTYRMRRCRLPKLL
jgi:hypothetical protein